MGRLGSWPGLLPEPTVVLNLLIPYITGKRLITGKWRTNRYIYLAPDLDLSTRVEAATGKVEVRKVFAERCEHC